MFRFFRTFRQRLLTENKFSKYLLYAIGEILLVVFGILIALQVDNWNEERKRQKEISQLLLDIEQDLLLNYESANFALDFYGVQDSLVKRIAHNQLSREDYINNSRLNYLIANWEYYLPAEKNINQFVESEKQVPSKDKSIVDALKKIQSLSSVLDDTWSTLAENIDENLRFLTDFNWYVKSDSLSNARRLEFFLNEEDYQTAVLRYWAITQNYYDKISRYRAQTMGALATIKRLKYHYSATETHSFFQKKGMPEFQQYPCGVTKSQLKSLKGIRSSELYGNLTQDTLNIILTNNKGQAISKFTMPPNIFMTVPGTDYFGLEGDYNTLAGVYTLAGNCVGVFGAFDNGFLLITEDLK